MAAVIFGELVRVFRRRLLMGHLLCCRLNMLFVHGRTFLWGRLSSRSALAVKAVMVVYSGVVNNGLVDISIMNYCCIYINYCSIVTETVTNPVAASEAYAAVTITVINSAIKAYMRTPVTGVKAIITPGKSPVSGCPKQPWVWRSRPIAGHPIVAAIVVIVGPITGYP